MKKMAGFHLFYYNYLRKKYNHGEKVIEYAYNMIDTCERFQEDPDCNIFLSILRGELPEEVYYDC